MPLRRLIAIAALAVVGLGQARAPLEPDASIECDLCAEWNTPQEPFRVYGNTYYVGTAGLGAVLIASPGGLILLDAALPQSALLIDASIRQLGFATEDIRLIVNTHAHFDHAGGIAALQRASGAVVAASAASAEGLRRGGPVRGDPQFAFGDTLPVVADVRVVADGETLRVGELAITAHLTPGHTPGSTTWSWVSCEGDTCLDVVYADSLNAVSADDFRFSADPAAVAAFRASIDTVAALPCDVLLAVHPPFIGMRQALERRAAEPDVNPFVDATACRRYADDARVALDRRLASEQQAGR